MGKLPQEDQQREASPGLRRVLAKLLKGEADSTLVQLFRYLQVAIVALGVDVGALYAFTEYVGLHYLVSAALAFVFGVTTNYLLSIRWVFKQSSLKDRRAEAVIFVLIGVAGLGLNHVILWFFTAMIGLHYMLSKLISAGLVFFFNFFVRKFLLFNKRAEAPDAGPEKLTGIRPASDS